MNVSELRQRVHAMPKVELHVHLEGAMDADTVWTMAQRNGVTLPGIDREGWIDHYRFRDFEHFINVYGVATEAMQTLDDWAFMVDRFLFEQARQNIVHSEVFLSASYALQRFEPIEWTATVANAARQGERTHGVSVRFIPDISRHLPDTAHEVLAAIIAADSRYFIGLGLGGIEPGHPAAQFSAVYRTAREQGLRVVAHAGEADGPASIWSALRDLNAERIGHGIRCLEDEELVRYLAVNRIPIEVCPTSNYCLGLVAPDASHPIRAMVDADLLCTVNSDDPPMFGCTLIDEYLLLYEQGFTWKELKTLNRNAVSASFLPDDEKNQLAARIEFEA